MPRRAQGALLFPLLCGCYLTTDTHRVTERADAIEAGVPLDSGERDGQMGALPDATSAIADASLVEPADAAVDAGCTSAEVCSVSTPVCRAGECIACATHADCARFEDTPACGPAGACVTCTSDRNERCTGYAPTCDPAVNSCVACVADADCKTEQQPACGADRKCAVCKEDADCSRFGKVCDTKSSACVQCRPETEEADCRTDRACDAERQDCAGTACDPQLFSCTTRRRGSVALCEACVSDSECMADHRCIPMTYGADGTRTELGGFCLKVATTGCTEPFRAAAITRASLSGAAATAYCGINEAVTSCAAIQALRADRDCTVVDDCDASGARCESVAFGTTKTCTYGCSSDRDCPSDVPCGLQSMYCGGP